MSKEKPKKLTLYVCRKIVRAMEQSDNIHNLIRLCPNQEVKSFLVKTRDELMTQAHDLMSKYQTSWHHTEQKEKTTLVNDHIADVSNMVWTNGTTPTYYITIRNDRQATYEILERLC